MLRTWANSVVNQYYQLVIELSDDPLEVPHIAPPSVLRDGASDVYMMMMPDTPELFGDATDAAPELAEEAVTEITPDTAPEDTAPEDTGSDGGIDLDPHWRLNDEILAIGTSRFVTQPMLLPRSDGIRWRAGVPENHLRSITWIDTAKIADVYDSLAEHPGMTKSNAEESHAIADLIRTVHSYRRVTHTQEGVTVTHSKLEMPLGDPHGE